MPAIARLAPRLLDGGTSGGISGTAIAVLVIVGIIPVVAVIWVAVWLLFGYSNGRNCCCMRRKKSSSTAPDMIESPMTSGSTLNEKTEYTLPQRPASAWRADSGSSREPPRSPGTLKKHRPRESLTSQWSSNSTIPVVQEPKQMV
ncbi:hypothetical protein E8E13_003631 [Curvularia kusanoi]|uniref:Uncharacterized protein n=1 Tax=Curvularia kusanoi TaxID=90978 RepID=A0A9P4T750_CURKU|nr:hypothetical protein E8E13_003631 [Curvularia kusanoi]